MLQMESKKGTSANTLTMVHRIQQEHLYLHQEQSDQMSGVNTTTLEGIVASSVLHLDSITTWQYSTLVVCYI